MCVYVHTRTNTHTHTHIYIYIYIYKCIGHEKFVFKSLTSVNDIWLDNVKITFKQLS